MRVATEFSRQELAKKNTEVTSLLECYEWFGDGFRIRNRHTISPCSDHLPWSSPKPL